MAKVFVHDILVDFLNEISSTSPLFNWFGWLFEKNDEMVHGELDDNMVALIGCSDVHDVVEMGVSLLSARASSHPKVNLKSCYYLSMGIPLRTVADLILCNIHVTNHKDIVAGNVELGYQEQCVIDNSNAGILMNDSDDMSLDDVLYNIRMSCLQYQSSGHTIELAIIADISRVRNSTITKSLCEFRKLARDLNITIVAMSFVDQLIAIDPESADIYLRLEPNHLCGNGGNMHLVPIFGMDCTRSLIMHKYDNGSIKAISTQPESIKND